MCRRKVMIVGISGSPRKGATEHILETALSMLEAMGFKTEIFTVRDKQIGFCIHCDYCLRNTECAIKDDMFALYNLLKDAEGIIFATPVYNGGVSAQAKTIMDRCRALLAADPNALKYKLGAAIAVGGDRSGGQELAIQQIHTFYILNGVIPISGGFFGANLGASLWSKDSVEGVKKDEEGLRSLKKTMKKLAKAMKKIEIKDNGE
jgi:multimeric flavodoxin WrbA